jgi:hypothetical protein
MLSNRHFGKPESKPAAAGKAAKSLQVSGVNVGGREVFLILLNWDAVKGGTELNNTFALVRQLFPGKNLVLVSRDPLKYGQPTVFFGPPDMARLFEGRQIGDFKWSQVNY